MTTFEEMAATFDEGDEDTRVVPTNDVAPTRPYDEPNISSDEFWSKDFSEQAEAFRELRENKPISWQRPIESTAVPDPDDPGWWAIVKYDDIIEVSQRNKDFVSGFGMMFDTLPPMFLAMAPSFLAMDDPEHNRLRRLVVSTFTPRQIKRIEDDIASRAEKIVSAAAEKAKDGATINFVEEISRHLPIEMYGDFFGIPAPERYECAHAADEMMAWADPELLAGRDPTEVQMEATSRVHEIGSELCEARRKEPKDDLITSLVNAEVEGERLSDFDIGAIMTLFSVAATDTTRHTTNFAVKALTDFPDQRKWLWEDFEGRIGTAVEEFLRFGSVVLSFRRTAVVETELRGQKIMPGDKLVFMYASGNRDADAFENPDVFDLSRDPNKHVAFGGGGVHYCVGTHLARAMLRSVFRELHRQIPDFAYVGEPTYMKTNFIRGMVDLPFQSSGFKA
jgi:cytochrome P450